MACVVYNYCCKCSPCQQRKQLAPVRALLTSVPIIGNLWQMIAVHILEVALSVNNNMYLFVIQDYFTKWTEAIPLHNQIAAAITTELIILLAKFGIPDTLHSDQGRNFESALMKQTLEAFGVHKLKTTAYHPQGDGIIKRFNRLFRQLLLTYVEQETDWECFLPLVLHAYRTTIHSSMWTSPFVLVFSRHPKSATSLDMTQPRIRITFFPKWLHWKIWLKQTWFKQLHSNGCTITSTLQHFNVGDCVGLSNLTASKLDPKWEGRWRIVEVESPLNMKIKNERQPKLGTSTVYNIELSHYQARNIQWMNTSSGNLLRLNTWLCQKLIHPLLQTAYGWGWHPKDKIPR